MGKMSTKEEQFVDESMHKHKIESNLKKNNTSMQISNSQYSGSIFSP